MEFNRRSLRKSTYSALSVMQSRLTIRPAGPSDAVWMNSFLRDRWGTTTIVAHGEVIEAARLPALIAGDRQGLATYRRLDRDLGDHSQADIIGDLCSGRKGRNRSRHRCF